MSGLLDTRRGRLTAFFFLYLTEGLPQGFLSGALADQMRRTGMESGDVMRYISLLYLPWSFKWMMGPIVDNIGIDRLGRRRGWIIGCQMMMALTVLLMLPLDPAMYWTAFIAVVMLHSAFAATQDVAIDALAVRSLPEDERGVANGLMFAAAYLGSTIGHSGALFLASYLGFEPTYLAIAASIMAVTIFITLRVNEPRTRKRVDRSIRRELKEYVLTAGRAFFGRRAAIAGMIFAILPAGSYALGLTLQASLAVELGFSRSEVATLALVSGLLSAGACLCGGWLSDRMGRRKAMAIFLVSTALPTIALAYVLHNHDWTKPAPIEKKAEEPEQKDQEREYPRAARSLILAFWIAAIAYALLHGLMYGTRPALFMDICDPRVAGTQFTAYMALLNFVMFYTGQWQAFVIENWGYSLMLVFDGLAGCVCLCVLPLMTPHPGNSKGSSIDPEALADSDWLVR